MLGNMSNPQRVPGKAKLQSYLEQGLTQAQIVDAWDKESNYRVSRSAIGMAIERYGLKSAHPVPRYPELLPWVIERRHRDAAEARLLRFEGARRAGRPLRPMDEHWLDKWLKALAIPGPNAPDGHVVTYSTEKGFEWAPRRAYHTDIIDPPDAQAS